MHRAFVLAFIALTASALTDASLAQNVAAVADRPVKAGVSVLDLPARLITAVVRTAQGSATVSMITAAGIVGGMATSAALNFHILYIGLAIACGSKLVPWMNDSGFWIVSKMSNLTEEETLKSFSVMQTIMGITGLVVILIAAKLIPLV